MKKNYWIILGLFFSILGYNFSVEYSSELFSQDQLSSVIAKNRVLLSTIPKWIDDASYENAFYNYGLPPRVHNLINLPVGDDITYSDALIYLSKYLKKMLFIWK